jgi:hypothetical protein
VAPRARKINGMVLNPSGEAQVQGRVSPNGAVRVTVQAGGQWASGSVRLSSIRGGGVWRGQGNAGFCQGTWVAERRGGYGAGAQGLPQTGQSEAIHSPEACAKTVLSRTMPAVSSIEVVCTVAISCWLKVLRTMSSPLGGLPSGSRRSADANVRDGGTMASRNSQNILKRLDVACCYRSRADDLKATSLDL